MQNPSKQMLKRTSNSSTLMRPTTFAVPLPPGTSTMEICQSLPLTSFSSSTQATASSSAAFTGATFTPSVAFPLQPISSSLEQQQSLQQQTQQQQIIGPMYTDSFLIPSSSSAFVSIRQEPISPAFQFTSSSSPSLIPTCSSEPFTNCANPNCVCNVLRLQSDGISDVEEVLRPMGY